MKGKTLRIKIKKKIQMGILLGAVLLTLGGCSFLNPGETAKQEEAALSGVVTLTPGMYDSEDTAIVIKKNTEDSTIQFQNLTTGKKYTLNYDGATHIYDKYDQAISLEQVECGSIVTVRFYKPKKLLASLKLDKQAMHFEELENFVLDTKRGTIAVGETVYNLSSHLVIISQEEQIEVMDINQMDVLSVWGYNNQVYSINVEQGHGYLRLQNDTYFVDGWIDIGQKMIRKITEDMLIVVPEGKIAIKVSHNGSSAIQEITFARNEEMVWDLGDVEITEIQKGMTEDLDMNLRSIGLKMVQFRINEFSYPENIEKRADQAAEHSMIGDMNRFQQVSMVDSMTNAGSGGINNQAAQMANNMMGMQMGMMMGQQMMNNMQMGMQPQMGQPMQQPQMQQPIQGTGGEVPKFCPNCGNPTNGARFCGNCGTKLA